MQCRPLAPRTEQVLELVTNMDFIWIELQNSTGGIANTTNATGTEEKWYWLGLTNGNADLAAQQTTCVSLMSLCIAQSALSTKVICQWLVQWLIWPVPIRRFRSLAEFYNITQKWMKDLSPAFSTDITYDAARRDVLFRIMVDVCAAQGCDSR
jgi:hypothetical protein